MEQTKVLDFKCAICRKLVGNSELYYPLEDHKFVCAECWSKTLDAMQPDVLDRTTLAFLLRMTATQVERLIKWHAAKKEVNEVVSK